MSDIRFLAIVILVTALATGLVVRADDPSAQPPAEAASSETPEAPVDPDAWRTAHPAGYDEWRPIKREEWDTRLKNGLQNFRRRVTECEWTPEEAKQVEENLEHAIRVGVSPDLALTFAERCIQWRFAAADAKRIVLTLTEAIRSDGKCCNISDLLDETFSSSFRGDDLVNALENEIHKRRKFEEGMIPQEERRKLERKEAEDLARREAEKKAAEERGKSPEVKKEEEKRKRH